MGIATIAERGALAARHLGLAPPPLPTPFFDTWAALLAARAVMAATRLGVIDALGEEADDAAGVARRLKLDARGVDALLGGLASLGYVRRRRDGRYRLSRTARQWLSAESDHAIAGLAGDFTYDLWDHMVALERVLEGGDGIGLHGRHPDDPYWERYQRAMHELAGMWAPVVARTLPLREPRRLLDLAGGCGRYAEALCRRHPGLHATIAELEAPARLGRTRIARAGLADRIEYLEQGDLFAADLGTGYDVVTANSVLHNLTPDRCAGLLRRAHDALRPNGLVAVLDMDRAAGTRVGELGALLFHVFEPGTRTWTADELAGYVRTAGFERIRVRRPPRLGGAVVVLGRRPATAGTATRWRP